MELKALRIYGVVPRREGMTKQGLFHSAMPHRNQTRLRNTEEPKRPLI